MQQLVGWDACCARVQCSTTLLTTTSGRTRCAALSFRRPATSSTSLSLTCALFDTHPLLSFNVSLVSKLVLINPRDVQSYLHSVIQCHFSLRLEIVVYCIRVPKFTLVTNVFPLYTRSFICRSHNCCELHHICILFV